VTSEKGTLKLGAFK